MDAKQKQKLKRFIRELSLIRGRHTELVSVYIPAGYELHKIINHLEQEKGTASNIKDAKTRNHVISSLEKAIRHLRLFKRTPENGYAVFSGNDSEKESIVNIKVWGIEPPEPLNIRVYRCDQTFLLEPLKQFIETEESYGLIVMDRREATIGLLKGSSIKALDHMTSGVPGKTRAGGQCLNPNTFVMTHDGDIIEIKNTHNPLKTISCDLKKQKSSVSDIKEKWENRKKLFKITTKYPRMIIESSKDHTFFTRTEKGIEEKPLSKLKEGEYLIMSEKINLNLKDQKINFAPKIKQKNNMKKVKIPKKINKDFAKLLGYYLGDGSYEIDRLTFFEQRKEVAEYYQKLIKNIFKIESKLTFRKDKNYYQLRVYSRIIAQLFKQIFQENNKTLNEKIPSIILKSSNESLAAFISGFFDAEGYVSGRIGLGINNKQIAQQLQLALLRFGILSSLWEYDNKRNPYSDNIRYTISIDDRESLIKFNKLIGFCSKEKRQKLLQVLSKRKNISNIRQLLENGKTIKKLFWDNNETVHKLKLPSFFSNQRQLSKQLFKERIVNSTKHPALKKELLKHYNSELIPVKISKIEPCPIQKTIDIETSNHNFIANGLLVHNSAMRYERLREGAAKEFFKRISGVINKEFLGKKQIKGILIGGPGHTKNEFKDYLNQEIQNKIVSIKDLTYTDESGLHDLVQLSQSALAEEQITHERQLLETFFSLLAKEPEKVAYGEEEVKKALNFGAAKILLLSEDIDDDLVQEFEEIAEKTRTQIEIISTETREGNQLKDLGGIAAILRYALQQ